MDNHFKIINNYIIAYKKKFLVGKNDDKRFLQLLSLKYYFAVHHKYL